jgi:hypothetical protein
MVPVLQKGSVEETIPCFKRTFFFYYKLYSDFQMTHAIIVFSENKSPNFFIKVLKLICVSYSKKYKLNKDQV